jgi:hypothetical protein
VATVPPTNFNGVFLEAAVLALWDYFPVFLLSGLRFLIPVAYRKIWNDLNEKLKPCSAILRFLFDTIPEARDELARCQRLTKFLGKTILACRALVVEFVIQDLEWLIVALSDRLSGTTREVNQLHKAHDEATPLYEPNFWEAAQKVTNFALDLGRLNSIITKLWRRFGTLLPLCPERYRASLFENSTSDIPPTLISDYFHYLSCIARSCGMVLDIEAIYAALLDPTFLRKECQSGDKFPFCVPIPSGSRVPIQNGM